MNTVCLAVVMALTVAALGTVSVFWAEAAEAEGMVITATANADSPIVVVTGHTIKSDPVLFKTLSPSYNVVWADQVHPDDVGEFETSFNISGLTEDGLYTIVANQGLTELYELKVQVSVVDGAAIDTVATQSNFEKAVAMVGTDLFAGGIEMTAEALEGSDTIYITGQTDVRNKHVTLTVYAPNGNVISVDQVRVNLLDGLFYHELMIGGPLWSQDGDYTVMAQQDEIGYETSVTVGVQDGVAIPEFGTVAMLILAVAIVAIVAMSSKSGLNIIPRF